jgi:PST family polysaccharide transporter
MAGMSSKPATYVRSTPDEPRTQREPKESDRASYRQILKSTALIGGASVINLAIGIVRTKAMALLLGPAGMGVMGLYSAVAELSQAIAGMGVISSGVRQIAEAAGSGETRRIALTVTVLRRTALVLGIFGALLLAAVALPVSEVTFGTSGHAGAIALLSLAVLLRVVSDGQAALLQGLRRIGDLAKLGMLGGVGSLLVGVPVIYALGEEGIVPSLIAGAGLGLLGSWWYSRRIEVETPRVRASQWVPEVAELLKLGFAFMASGLMMAGAAYAIRMMVSRTVGIEAAGLYQSAWTIGGMYVGVVLQAMGADFYPRLTAAVGNPRECNRLVNEQTHASLLLAAPGALGTLALAPLVIDVLYSAKFGGAVEVLRWLCFGMLLRILSWPMGFIILAKGARNFFFWSEAAWTGVYLGLASVCIDNFGLAGAGIAFLASYVFHCLLIYPIARHLTGFCWSAANLDHGLLFLSLMILVFFAFEVMPPFHAIVVGIIATVLSAVYSAQSLLTLVSLDTCPAKIRNLLQRFVSGIAPRNSGEILAQTVVIGSQSRRHAPSRILLSLFMFGSSAVIWVYWFTGRYEWQPWLQGLAIELESNSKRFVLMYVGR